MEEKKKEIIIKALEIYLKEVKKTKDQSSKALFVLNAKLDEDIKNKVKFCFPSFIKNLSKEQISDIIKNSEEEIKIINSLIEENKK